MSLLEAREALDWTPGDNATDILIHGVHFNLSTIREWNYTLYSNDTISNGTWGHCYLMDPPYTPNYLFPNGTWNASSWCYSPVEHSGNRAHIGIGVAVAFALCLALILVNLPKHGKLYLPVEKRFVPIGRRWQWYWSIFVCAAALIGIFGGLDVERYRVLELPIVLNVFFWYLMQMGTMALIWEGVRHWGSWMERQYIDPNPFMLPESDMRWRFEFFIPLVFYFFLWLHFFIVVPRNWGAIELQRSPEQTLEQAQPAATDGRFKTAPFLLFVCWVITCVSLWHSIRHYEPRNRGWWNRIIGFVGYIPFRFVLMLPLSLALIGYQALASWDFSVSPLNAKTNLLAMYLGGYAPSLLIVVIQIAAGFLRPNEDRELLRQRRVRGRAIDAELGIVHKPAWWQRLNGDVPNNYRDRIMRNLREVGGGRPTAKHVENLAEQRAAQTEEESNNVAPPIEMNSMRRTNSIASSVRTGGTAPPPYTLYQGKSATRRNERAMQAAVSLLFPGAADTPASSSPYQDETNGTVQTSNQQHHHSGNNSRRRSDASDASMSGPPQQVRSMLDI